MQHPLDEIGTSKCFGQGVKFPKAQIKYHISPEFVAVCLLCISFSRGQILKPAFLMHFFFLAKNTVTKTRALDFLFPAYELTNTFQDQHISNLCFPINSSANLFQPHVQREKLHLEEPCIWKTRIVAVVVVVIPFLTQDLRVHCCPGCRQRGDGRAKEGTEQIVLQGTGKQDQG